MLTTYAGQSGTTRHAINRDGTATLCRSNLTPREYPVRDADGRTTHYAASIRPGLDVDCTACLRKLAKITAEAFDAATAIDTELTRALAAAAALAERMGQAPASALSPFAVGSYVAAHLSPERVYLVDSVEVGAHDGVTRVYLAHADGERLAFRPSVLGKMYAPASVVEPVQYRIRNANTGKTYLVLGTGPARNAPHITVVWVQVEGEQGAAPWNPAEMVSPHWPLVAVDADGNPQRAHTLDDSIAEIARVGAAYPDGITYVGDRRA